MPHLPSHVHYWLAGTGPLTSAYEALILRRGLESRVKLLGAVSDRELAALYARSSLLIMPNVPVPHDMEGFGMVMLEAGAVGLPAIAADLEGIRDVVTHGEGGSLVKAGDAPEFASAVRSELESDTRWQALAQGAEQRARELDWSNVVEKYLDVLRGPAASPSG